MLPKYPEFKTLEIDDLPLLSQHLNAAHPKICELAAANLIIWSDFDRVQLTIINHNLCLLINPLNECPFFMEPLGDNLLPNTIEICLNHAQKFSRIPASSLKNFPAEKFKIKELVSHADYIYERAVLAELKGKKFDGKRNHIKKFKSSFVQYQFVPLAPKHQNEALQLFENWFAFREASRFFPRLAHTAQKAAVENAFRFFDKLALLGGAIYAEGKMLGFILGSRLNADTLAVHFSYGLPTVSGISQVLLQAACQKTFAPFKYVNLEQDLGIPGLRQAKLSYHPIKIEKKFEAHLATLTTN
ncbi:MAG: phosphatidylglycerol lysyltransferase domain-containing protein [Candidatus Margulisiibacteriota bacterium]